MRGRLFYISELIGKELNGDITVDESRVLDEWVNNSFANKTLFDQLHNDAFVKQQLKKFDRYDIEKNRAYLMGKLEERVNGDPSTDVQGTKSIQLWKRIAVAASIVGVLFLQAIGFLNSPSTTLRTTDGPLTIVQDVQAPDKNRAQIKLPDGTTIFLDSASNGELGSINGVKLVKTADGKIEYSFESNVVGDEIVYSTFKQPKRKYGN
ncbi:MAG: hypothetical protein IPK31_13765 [Chitinophagaceae bacterium]|nr:hypothetical protein [Chitinophagaceae bacterium]